MKTVTVTEASRNFSDLVSHVHYRGESALLLKGGRPMVRLVPARRARTGAELAGRWASAPHLDPTDVERFETDLKTARDRLPALRPKWE